MMNKKLSLRCYLKNSIIIIELKQWTHADAVPGKDGVVSTITGKALREVTHPSYQAWSYASLIDSYNQEVYDRNVGLHPCAFLHNYDLTDNDPINSEQYKDYINAAPMFGAKDFEKLRELENLSKNMLPKEIIKKDYILLKMVKLSLLKCYKTRSHQY